MKIAVFGVGGVGGYFGGRLCESGQDVAFIARGAMLDALRREGLRIGSPKGDIALPKVTATSHPEEIGPVDFVLVGVKTWQVAEAARAMRLLVGEGTAIVPLENGVEAADQLVAVHGAEHVIGGTCRIVAKILGPGRIGHLGVEPYVAIGELDRTRSERVDRLADAFRAAGVTVETPDDIHVAIWEKFLFIAAASGVGSVTRVPFGKLREVPESRALVERAMTEIAAVADARGVSLPGDAVSRTMKFFDGLPAESTSSMQRDIMEGRPSELTEHNGAVVRLGHELGVPVPVNEFLYAALLPQERAARKS